MRLVARICRNLANCLANLEPALRHSDQSRVDPTFPASDRVSQVDRIVATQRTVWFKRPLRDIYAPRGQTGRLWTLFAFPESGRFHHRHVEPRPPS